MPYAPPRPCTSPGCPALVTGRVSRCEEHYTPRYRGGAGRPSASKQGYDDKWRKFRKAQLARPENAICCWIDRNGQRCWQPATVLDHIVPVKEAPHLRLDPENVRGLCAACHNRRHGREWS